MARKSRGINPEFTVGQTIDLFGVKATVTGFEPFSDFAWNIMLSTVNGGGAAEFFTIVVPTDYDTQTGKFAWA